MGGYCCAMFEDNVNHWCDIHGYDWQCPDVVLREYGPNKWGLPIHDGGSSVIEIKYCPWCSEKLSRVALRRQS